MLSADDKEEAANRRPRRSRRNVPERDSQIIVDDPAGGEARTRDRPSNLSDRCGDATGAARRFRPPHTPTCDLRLSRISPIRNYRWPTERQPPSPTPTAARPEA
jgi:hypothetical protein